MTAQQRDNVFDIMKGLAIISVVAGHCGVPIVEGFVNQYHLATFYFVAGYFFSPHYIDDAKSFVVKRIKRLYLPFVCYGLAFLLLHNVFCSLGLYRTDAVYSTGDFFRNGLRLLFQLVSFEPFMGAMWFASSLLTVSVVYVAVRKISGPHGLKTAWGGVILCTLIGFLCIKLHVKNPLCIWNAIIVVMIYHLGAVFKKYQLLQRYVNSGVTLTCIILTVGLYMLGGIVRLQPSEMISNNPLLFFVVPIVGVAMVYGVSKWISRTRIASAIARCGDRSFEIMALHLISFKLVAVVHVFIEGGGFAHLSDFPVYGENLAWWTPLYVLVGCAVPIAASRLMDKVKSSFYRNDRNRNRIVQESRRHCSVYQRAAAEDRRSVESRRCRQ